VGDRPTVLEEFARLTHVTAQGGRHTEPMRRDILKRAHYVWNVLTNDAQFRWSYGKRDSLTHLGAEDADK
jgi:hypothetical protein